MSTSTIEQLRDHSKQADEMIATLRRQIADLSKVVLGRQFSEEIARLRQENKHFATEIESLKTKLIQIETLNGVKQIPIPNGNTLSTPTITQAPIVDTPKVETATKEVKAEKKQQVKSENAASKKVSGKVSDQQNKGEKVEETEPDFSQLDLKVGLIVSAKKHPDADSLYVEEVDLGEEKPRTVVSGLVKFVPLEEMQNRLAVLLCNLKPAKMRGVTSEAMVMCASTPEKVEILNPPAGSQPGDRVICEGYPGEPEKQLNPKKKIFEQVAPHLKTNESCEATYKGSPLIVKGKGVILAPSLKCVQIK